MINFDLFGTRSPTSNTFYEPLDKKKLMTAMKEIKKIQKSNTILELFRNLESVIKKEKITQIKVIHNDYLHEGEILISYNPKK